MSRRYIFSSESVGEGHPDKVCDAISDAVLDACIEHDRRSRVACETFAKSNIVIVGGEITIPSLSEDKPLASVLPVEQLVRDTVRGIGYVNDDDVFHADKIFITNIITKQSPDIAQGVDARSVEGKDTAEQGAGDQGLMFGYACDETPELMPAPIMFAHRLGRELTRIRKNGKVGWLRPDAKSQVSVIYENGKPIGISCVVVSTQHTRDVKHSELRSFVIEEVIKKVLPKEMLSEKTQFLVNPTGNFVVGGPSGRRRSDRAQNHRRFVWRNGPARRRRVLGKRSEQSRSQRCLHGTLGCQKCGGVRSGEKMRSAIRLRHWPSGAASVHIDTFGTHAVNEEAIERAVLATFSFKPADIIKQLNLLHPIYSKTTNYGHFGKIDDPDITWESLTKRMS
jgi:S-adenosylmethionine synthetase